MENTYASQTFDGYSLPDGGPPVMYSSEHPYEYAQPQPVPYLPDQIVQQQGYETYLCATTADAEAYENCLEFMNTPDTYPYTGSPSSTATDEGSTASNSYYYPVYSDQYPLESVRAAADSSSQSPDPASEKPKTRKRRSPEIQARQRNAANERERRRMLSINKAFEKLRHRVPTLPYEKRLSKVDTLRLTIGYIHILEDLLKSDDEHRATKGSDGSADSTQRGSSYRSICRPPPPKKVVVECHSGGVNNFEEEIMGISTVRAHSLSWKKPDERNPQNPTLSAKLWMPQAQNPASSSSSAGVDSVSTGANSRMPGPSSL